MQNTYFKIRESVDIYTLLLADETYRIEFYRINTRERKSIETDKVVLDILVLLDGTKTILEIANITNTDIQSIENLVSYLIDNGFAIKADKDKKTNKRFKRQISFFDDLVPNKLGENTQELLSSKKIVIFGVGAVGGDIAILLARAGVKNFVFVDYKKLVKSNIVRHLYCSSINIDKPKTEALKEYIQKIDKTINITCINEKLIPYTNLDDFIPKDTDMVINSADEPYIGHTSVKIGRYVWQKDIAMYVAGGFDAHSMSTGELIVPKKTACIDCYQNSFQKALEDWKPSYNTEQEQGVLVEEGFDDVKDIIVGSSGSIAQASLFSASYGAMKIIFHLIGIDVTKDSKRGEYLINKGIFNWVDFTKEECEICKR
jgi:molybdopterin/thiamine biosynthesis adenylyltransferase